MLAIFSAALAAAALAGVPLALMGVATLGGCFSAKNKIVVLIDRSNQIFNASYMLSYFNEITFSVGVPNCLV